MTMTKFNSSLAAHQTGILDESVSVLLDDCLSHIVCCRRFSENDIIWFNSIADEYMICLKMDKERLDVCRFRHSPLKILTLH